jgi:hypothetical protein
MERPVLPHPKATSSDKITVEQLPRDYLGNPCHRIETPYDFGAIVDLGCFVGSTTISLAQGLRASRIAEATKIHAYDYFVWDDFIKSWWEAKNLPLPDIVDDSFLPEFLKRTLPWKDRIIVHQQDLTHVQWQNGPIEFLLVDAMKSPQLAGSITHAFFPYLIPGKSYLAPTSS